MPETGFFFSERDFISLVEHLLSQDATLVPDVKYAADEYVLARSTAQLETFRPTTKQFFVLHPSYQVCPLEMRPLEKAGQETRYFIMPRNGGPSIDVYCAGEVESAGQPFIGSGMLGHYPTFWNQEVEENQPAPQALVEFYRSTVKWLRGYARRIKIAGRNYYLGPDAARLLAAGHQLVTPEGR
jgi:hypothetical protein